MPPERQVSDSGCRLLARAQAAVEAQSGSDVREDPFGARLRHREQSLLFFVRERLPDRRLRVLEHAVVVFESIPEPRVAEQLAQHRELAVDRLRSPALISALVLIHRDVVECQCLDLHVAKHCDQSTAVLLPVLHHPR
jgi:hypothetical protein